MEAGGTRSRSVTVRSPAVRTALLMALIAVGLGLTAASGTLSTESDPTVTDRSIIMWALVGGAVAGSIGLGIHVALVRSGRRPAINALTAAVTTAALGALVGIANTQGARPVVRGPDDEASVAGLGDVGLPLQPAGLLPDERRPAATWGDSLGGSIALLVGLGLLFAAMVLFARRSELRERDRNAVYLRSDLLIDEPEAIDDEAVAGALRTTLEQLRASDDPRLAIRAAYGTLLDGLADIGLERRSYEAPAEYVRRCFSSRALPDRPISELLHLFELARFSTRPISAAHATQAERALVEAIDHMTLAPT